MLWHSLTDLSQLELIKRTSEEQSGQTRTVLIFKHSTRCGISAMALNRLESKWPDPGPFPCYFLDLLKHRDISDRIAAEFNVAHQSPQVLLIRNGICIYHSSHSDIRVEDILSQ
ncbi:MAG: bacillithiol system redox-active protein YtxJ [Bacteroidia bacterium]